jgi:hypothetical protein
LRNSCKQRCSGGFSTCSQKLRWPIDVFAEVRNRGLSGKMFRQKKHIANSSSAPFDVWSGMFIATSFRKGLPLQVYHVLFRQLRGEPYCSSMTFSMLAHNFLFSASHKRATASVGVEPET